MDGVHGTEAAGPYGCSSSQLVDSWRYSQKWYWGDGIPDAVAIQELVAPRAGQAGLITTVAVNGWACAGEPTADKRRKAARTVTRRNADDRLACAFVDMFGRIKSMSHDCQVLRPPSCFAFNDRATL